VSGKLEVYPTLATDRLHSIKKIQRSQEENMVAELEIIMTGRPGTNMKPPGRNMVAAVGLVGLVGMRPAGVRERSEEMSTRRREERRGEMSMRRDAREGVGGFRDCPGMRVEAKAYDL